MNTMTVEMMKNWKTPFLPFWSSFFIVSTFQARAKTLTKALAVHLSAFSLFVVAIRFDGNED